MGYKLNAFTGELDRVGTSVPVEGGFPITPFVVGPVDEAGYQTVQAGMDAAKAAGGGIVYIQPGTYTEDTTLYDGVHLFGSSESSTLLIGTHTPPASGTINFWRMDFQDETAIFSSLVAGTTAIVVEDCSVNVTNGYTFDLPNWTGSFEIFDMGPHGTNDGGINNTGGATYLMFAAGLGNGTGKSMILSGTIFVSTSDITCPIDFQTGATGSFDNCFFTRPITFSNDSAIKFSNGRIVGGTSPAITMNSSGSCIIQNAILESTNDPAIDGTSAGALTIINASYPNNANIASTVTTASGKMRGNNNITRFVVGPAPDAPYQVIQTAMDDANADSGGPVYIYDGTYTENLIMYDNVDLIGIPATTLGEPVKIIGTHVPPVSGTVRIRNISIETPNNGFLQNLPTTVDMSFESCSFDVGQVIVSMSSHTGSLRFENCTDTSTGSGIMNNTTGANLTVKNSFLGVGAGNSTIVSGTVIVDNLHTSAQFQMSGATFNVFGGSRFENIFSTVGAAVGSVSGCSFFTGASQSITHNSTGAISVTGCTINSSNSPSIGGSGAGIMTETGNLFLDNSEIAGTITLAGGTLKGGELIASPLGKGLSVTTGINSRAGSAVLVAGTVVVANTSVTANTGVHYSRSTTGGTPGHLSTTQIASTSFTINSTDAADTSTIEWILIEKV